MQAFITTTNTQIRCFQVLPQTGESNNKRNVILFEIKRRNVEELFAARLRSGCMKVLNIYSLYQDGKDTYELEFVKRIKPITWGDDPEYVGYLDNFDMLDVDVTKKRVEALGGNFTVSLKEMLIEHLEAMYDVYKAEAIPALFKQTSDAIKTIQQLSKFSSGQIDDFDEKVISLQKDIKQLNKELKPLKLNERNLTINKLL